MESLGRLAETRCIPAQPAGHIRDFGGGGQLTKAYEVHCEPWDQASSAARTAAFTTMPIVALIWALRWKSGDDTAYERVQ
jgi:hypothetical protein